MATPSSTICWPSRFLARALAALFFGMVLGLLIAIFTKPKPPPPIDDKNDKGGVPRQVFFEVYVRFGGAPEKRILADLYYGKSESEIVKGKYIPVFFDSKSAKKSEKPGSTDFMIQPINMVDGKRVELGKKFHYQGIWPSHDNDTFTIHADAPYASPNFSYKETNFK